MSTSPSPCRRQLLRLAIAAAGSTGCLSHAHAAEPVPQPWPKQSATPALRLPRLDGNAWRLDEAVGKVVLLNFWATWCAPCREELPSLELLAHRHAEDGLAVMAINFRQGAGAVTRFVEAEGLSLPVLLDADGSAAKAWGARVLPTTVVIDRSGRAAFSVIGEIDWAGTQARGWLAPLLAAPPVPQSVPPSAPQSPPTPAAARPAPA